MPPERAEGIDFSSFLALVNAAIAAAILVMFFSRGPNEYVNAYTLCLSLAFAAQNHFFLLTTKRGPNPFLSLLIIHALFFYELRIATLLWRPWSTPFMYNAFGPVDLNSGLLFIILANFVMFLGLTAHSDKGFESGPVPGYGAVSVRLLLPVLIFSLGIILNLDIRLFNGLRGYFGIVFNPEVVLLFSLVLLFLYSGVVDKRQKALMSGMVLVFVAYRTAIGSRSALLLVFFFAFCAWSAVRGRLVFRWRIYIFITAMVPLAAALFLVGTNTHNRAPASAVNILDRIGFLDMATEIMSSSAHYRSVINFGHYFKSIVDSGLTPGFNIFDAPKAANILSFIYDGTPAVSLHAVSLKMNYHSDMFTAYGEAYALFGPIAGLAAIFVCAFLFQKIYRAVVCPDPFKQGALRAAVLVIFYTYFLDSLGFDWFVVDAVRSVLPFFLLLYLFVNYVKRVAARPLGGPQ